MAQLPRPLTPRPIVMRAGALIGYRLRVHGIPLRWQSEITIWEPPHRFVDERRRGRIPYGITVHIVTSPPFHSPRPQDVMVDILWFLGPSRPHGHSENGVSDKPDRETVRTTAYGD